MTPEWVSADAAVAAVVVSVIALIVVWWRGKNKQ